MSARVERLYLSGPMTNLPEFNFPAFDSAQAYVETIGAPDISYDVISPAEHDRVVIRERFNRGEIPYMRPDDVPGYAVGDVALYSRATGAVPDLLAWDFQQIIASDGIVMMPGWERSTGARAERYVAEATGKHVYLLTHANVDWFDVMIDGDDQWCFGSDIEQRRLHEHMAEFGAKLLAVPAECGPECEDCAVSIPAQPEKVLGITVLRDPRMRESDVFMLAGDFDGARAASGEVRVVDPTTGGAKGSKLARYDLVPQDALWALAEHFGRGARKYEDRNWEKGYAWSLSYAALQRHLAQWWQGEDIDPDPSLLDEDGVPRSLHLTAVAWHAMVLLSFALREAGTDNRPASWRPPHVVAEAPTAPPGYTWSSADER